MQKPSIMLHASIRFAAALGLVALTACSSNGDDDTGANAGTGGTGMPGSGGSGTGGTGTMGGAGMGASGSGGMPAATCNSGMITASPDTNYQFFSKLTIQLTSVKPSSEIKFDWSGVTIDFLKKP